MTTIAVIMTMVFSIMIAVKSKKKASLWVYSVLCLVLMPTMAYVFEGLRTILAPMTIGQVAMDFVFSVRSIFTAPFAYGTESFHPALAILGGTTTLSLAAASVAFARNLMETSKRERANERYE